MANFYPSKKVYTQIKTPLKPKNVSALRTYGEFMKSVVDYEHEYQIKKQIIDDMVWFQYVLHDEVIDSAFEQANKK